MEIDCRPTRKEARAHDGTEAGASSAAVEWFEEYGASHITARAERTLCRREQSCAHHHIRHRVHRRGYHRDDASAHHPRRSSLIEAAISATTTGFTNATERAGFTAPSILGPIPVAPEPREDNGYTTRRRNPHNQEARRCLHAACRVREAGGHGKKRASRLAWSTTTRATLQSIVPCRPTHSAVAVHHLRQQGGD